MKSLDKFWKVCYNYIDNEKRKQDGMLFDNLKKEVKMKVRQFLHANQFELYEEYTNTERHSLQSYDSLVCDIKHDIPSNRYIIRLGRDWDYSKTTSTHVFAFLEEYSSVNFYGVSNKRQYVNKLIKDGVILYDENMQ